MNQFTGFPRRLAKSAVVAALAVSALLPGLAQASPPPPPPIVPAAIAVPAGNVPYLVGHATGTQNYTCQTTSSGTAWTFVAPSATLVNDKGKQIAIHFAGPTWQAIPDGSTVVGQKLAGVTVDSTAIPWLLLGAKSTTLGPDGGDRLYSTTFVQRVNTVGGLAPTTGCDGTTVGAAANVPYTADYYFYHVAD
jgi:Protein of unknown function (DUF3455)